MTLTVLDPSVTIDCPADITVETSERVGTRVFWETTVEGGCGINRQVVCEPPSGSQFPPGVTTVVCTVGDPIAPNAECSFDVTVILKTVEIFQVGGNVRLCINTEVGTTYLIEAKDSLAQPEWELVREVLGTGRKVTIDQRIEPEGTRFFRVRVPYRPGENQLSLLSGEAVTRGPSAAFDWP